MIPFSSSFSAIYKLKLGPEFEFSKELLRYYWLFLFYIKHGISAFLGSKNNLIDFLSSMDISCIGLGQTRIILAENSHKLNNIIYVLQ